MTTVPAVSIIIASTDGRTYLEECLPSLARQTFTDFEVIIVDNGSSDGSAGYIADAWPAARVIVTPERLGFACAMNRGIGAARAPLVVILNNDVVLDAAWLAELVGCMRRHPDAGFCSSRAYSHADPQRIDGAGAALAMGGWVYEVGHGEIDRGAWDDEREVCVATGVSLMLRRPMLERIGTFDEAFETGSEDADLTLRAFLAGYRGFYAPASILHHRRRGTVSRRPAELVVRYQRNIELVILKNLPLGLLLRGVPARLAFWLASFALHVRDGNGLLFIRGKLAVIPALPHALRERRRLRRNRRVAPRELERLMTPGAMRRGVTRLAELMRVSPLYARTGTGVE